jgi:hypothetical protein
MSRKLGQPNRSKETQIPAISEEAQFGDFGNLQSWQFWQSIDAAQHFH